MTYYTSTVAIAAAHPTASEDGNPVAATDAFKGWSFKAALSTAKAQFAFYFQDATDTVYYEAGSTASVWFGVGSAGAANVETTAFEFVGAAQLTVAASAAIVVALLF